MSGIEGLVAGGAIALPFNALYDVLKGVVNNVRMFRSELEALRLKINSLGPLIAQIEVLNKRLGRNKREAEELLVISEKMRQGKELVAKCSQVGRWDFWKKNSYTRKLVELDGCLQRLLEILKLQGLVDGRETLIVAKRIDSQVNVFVQNQNEMQILVKEIHGWMANLGPWTAIMFAAVLLVSMVMLTASKSSNWFVFNVGNNTLTFNN